MIIAFPTNTKEIIDEIRDAIGRPVQFMVIASATACPACYLDPVNNTSTDSFCPVCHGAYWIPVMSGTMVTGHVSWGKSDQMRWETGGQWWEGSCGVQIEYTPENQILVNDAIYVVVDDKEMEIRKSMMRGVKDINRILIDLIEKTK
jgi:hypothetical protein